MSLKALVTSDAIPLTQLSLNIFSAINNAAKKKTLLLLNVSFVVVYGNIKSNISNTIFGSIGYKVVKDSCIKLIR